MYPSGRWDGFWQQAGFGRQPMDEFQLNFRRGEVTGQGTDIIGPFVIKGTFEKASGRVAWVKRYLGRHSVVYSGSPDGEGSIAGMWKIQGDYSVLEGSFLIRPVVELKDGVEMIGEIRPKN